MRKCVLMAAMLLVVLAGASGAWAQLQLKEGDTVAVCGDSITEQKQYSVFIEDYLLMCQPAAKLQTVQFGWSGETSWGFLNRMDRCVPPFKPQVATSCYGMNDGGYRAMTDATGKHYYDSMKAVVARFQKMGVRTIIVGSPGAVDSTSFRHDPKQAEVYNQTLDALTQIAAKVAKQDGVLFADVHTPMMEVMAKAKAKFGPDYLVCGGDGVHPSANGHLIMAYAFLKAMGCDGHIGTITLDYTSGQAAATDGHKVLSSAPGKVEIESTRYPFCFTGDPKSPNATSGIIAFFPFNQDLNRFMLVVKNAPTRATVTWGKESKVFTGTQLAQGINLAAEFLDNPFSQPFLKVQRAIQAQQNMETPLIKTLLMMVPQLEQWTNDKQDVAKIVDDSIQHDEQLRAAAAAQVVPVKYTITVAPAPEAGK